MTIENSDGAKLVRDFRLWPYRSLRWQHQSKSLKVMTIENIEAASSVKKEFML